MRSHTKLPDHRGSWRQRTWRAYVQLLKRTDWPILVGPWHGEVGFEVMYWIPFLERLKKEGIAAERLIPITRGGAGAWYHVPQGIELFAMRTPQQMRIENRLQHDKRGLLKQTEVTPFDQQILTDAADTLRLGRTYHTLHPAWMYHVLAPFWTGGRGFRWLLKQTEFPQIPYADVPDSVKLPEVFVATRFYHRETWPIGHKMTSKATEAILCKLAEQQPVVVLESATVADEHLDFVPPKHPNILRLRDLTTLRPETNLHVQSAVIARAQGFVGVYGGLSQLALRMMKPAVTFYQDWGGTSIAHRNLSDVLSAQTGIPFLIVRAQEVPLLNAILPEVEVRPRSGPILDTKKAALQDVVVTPQPDHAIVAP
jgi:hypothetical protein